MLEAECRKCGEIFVPADKNDTIHSETADGYPCGGVGVITGTWVRIPRTEKKGHPAS